jgi:glycolate oxidase iron-sulfur subunit
MSEPFPADVLIAEANRCVACGLCLPHCPTYRKTQSEADSPRGRIALIRGVLEQRIPLNDRFEQHIDQCLACRSCERVCPSGVKYGQLVDGARAVIVKKTKAKKLDVRGFMLDRLIPNASALRLSARLLRFSQKTGLPRIAAKMGFMREAIEHAPVMPPVNIWRVEYPAVGALRGEVLLFLGCVAQVLDAETLNAAIFVMNRLGYTVRVPQGQTCCGALHQHGGEPDRAADLARQNLQAFDDLTNAPIVSAASGCGATLAEYGQTLGENGRAFSLRAADINAFLDKAAGWEKLAIQPLAGKIAVHDACTLRNVLRAEQAPYRLLARIPQAEIVPLAGNDQCCGAAGLYAYDQPEMAGRLMSDKIAAIRESGARYIATANIGCALGMANGLRAAGLDVEVLHPVTLLARQMGFKKSLFR